MGSQGKGLGDKTAPVGVGLLDGEGGSPGHVSIEEGGADSVEGGGLSLGSKSSNASLKKARVWVNPVPEKFTICCLTRMI